MNGSPIYIHTYMRFFARNYLQFFFQLDQITQYLLGCRIHVSMFSIHQIGRYLKGNGVTERWFMCRIKDGEDID
jgi:hypothetical protein